MNYNLLSLINSESVWAISERGKNQLCSLINCDSMLDMKIDRSESTLSQYASKISGRYFSWKVDNVGIISVYGVLVSRPFLWFTDYETLSVEFNAFEADKDITDIVLIEDTPGGMLTGVSGFANLIKKSSKNVVAHPVGMADSAGYWIASQANKIIAVDTADVGSIGVASQFIDASEYWAKKGVKIIDIASEQTPRKRVDYTTEEGRKEYQQLLNESALVFEQAVADGRGVDLNKVRSDFGQGAFFSAATALEKGMIDSISATADLISGLVDSNKNISPFRVAAKTEQKGKVMSDQKTDQTATLDFEKEREAAVEQAIAAERKRVASINAINDDFKEESNEVKVAVRDFVAGKVSDPDATYESVSVQAMKVAFSVQKKMIDDWRSAGSKAADIAPVADKDSADDNIAKPAGGRSAESKVKGLAAAMVATGREC